MCKRILIWCFFFHARFAGQKHVGGCDTVVSLDGQGKLVSLVNAWRKSPLSFDYYIRTSRWPISVWYYLPTLVNAKFRCISDVLFRRCPAIEVFGWRMSRFSLVKFFWVSSFSMTMLSATHHSYVCNILLRWLCVGEFFFVPQLLLCGLCYWRLKVVELSWKPSTMFICRMFHCSPPLSFVLSCPRIHRTIILSYCRPNGLEGEYQRTSVVAHSYCPDIDAVDFQSTIAGNQVVIFSKTICPYSRRVKALFAESYPSIHLRVIE